MLWSALLSIMTDPRPWLTVLLVRPAADHRLAQTDAARRTGEATAPVEVVQLDCCRIGLAFDSGVTCRAG
jgi:hypothetical protein